MIDEIAALDEEECMVLAVDAIKLAESAARFFEVPQIQRREEELTLVSCAREQGWTLKVNKRYVEMMSSSDNPWLDFLCRHYRCWILV